MNNRFIVEAPAKINLTLDVLFRRNDGYHEIKTVMHKINLLDKIYIKALDQGIVLGSDSQDIPADHTNLAYQAAQKLLSQYGDGRGAEIFIEKHIPIAAGLAGGSADAAAVLQGLNEIYHLKVKPQEMDEIGAEIGSDIPFCLSGKPFIAAESEYEAHGRSFNQAGTALCEGRGERITLIENTYLPWILLVNPGFTLSTAAVYSHYLPDKVKKRPNTEAFLTAWRLCDKMNIAKNCENVLEQISTVMYPEILQIKQSLLDCGALQAVMSGSGPTVFGLFDGPEKSRTAQAVLAKKYREVHLVSSYVRGGV